MLCPVCGNKTKVTESREVDYSIIRRRVCTVCKNTFCTEEAEIDYLDGSDKIASWHYKENRRRRGKA